jgi:hypothetical protein
MQLLKGAAVGAIALAQLAAGKEMAQNKVMAAQLYASGVMMDRIMQTKQVRDLVGGPMTNLHTTSSDPKCQKNSKIGPSNDRSAVTSPPSIRPLQDSSRASMELPRRLQETLCTPSSAKTYVCQGRRPHIIVGRFLNRAKTKPQVDLHSFLSHAQLGSKGGQGSSSWGWTSPEGREFVAIGQVDGAAFVEINKEGQLVYLGRLPPVSKPAIWREIRGFKDYMIIGSESEGHGIQVFDMKKVRNRFASRGTRKKMAVLFLTDLKMI